MQSPHSQQFSTCSLCDIGGNSCYTKLIVQFLPRLGWASYLCCFLLDRILTTKRHSSDVYPSYIPIFSLFLEVVFPVGMTEIRFWFMRKHACTFLNLNRFEPKLLLVFAFRQQFLQSVRKKKKMKKFLQNFADSYLGNGLRDLLEIWPPQSGG